MIKNLKIDFHEEVPHGGIDPIGSVGVVSLDESLCSVRLNLEFSYSLFNVADMQLVNPLLEALGQLAAAQKSGK